MRIGLLTTSYPRWPGDIPGVFVHGFAHALAARGHRIEVLAPEPAEALPNPDGADVSLRWVPYLRPRGLQQTFYGAGVPDNLRRNPRAWLGLAPFTASLCWQTRKACRRWDAVISHWALPCALAATFARGGREDVGVRPHLAVLHSADVHVLGTLPTPLRRMVACRIVRSSDRLIFVAASLRTRFLSALPPARRAVVAARAHVMPMGVEPCSRPSQAEAAAIRTPEPGRPLVVLALGRLVPIKGMDTLIRAVAGTHGIRLWLVGDGPERERLQRLATRLGANVRFWGRRIGADKHDLLHAADVFVSASRATASGRSEGMPTTILEALRCGLPVIATRSGGATELLTHAQDAWIAEPGSTRELQHAIETLRADSRLRCTLAHRGRALASGYTWPALAPRIEGWLACRGSGHAGETPGAAPRSVLKAGCGAFPWEASTETRVPGSSG